MSGAARVALFADSLREVNGVALTCRMFEAFAARQDYPLLLVHAGEELRIHEQGPLTRCEIPTSRLALGLEQDLRFDLLFLRHRRRVREVLREFAPDLVHITGPNHTGMLGALLAHELGIPLVASWHTNLHEYAGRRLAGRVPETVAGWAERAALRLCLRFYATARLLFAPNAELVDMLRARTGRPCRLMRRGVDCGLFSPARRERRDGDLVVGYVGRLSREKSVRRLAEVERALEQAGVRDFRIETAGHGAERAWLGAHVTRLKDHGVLTGEALARVYAGFDIFAFPSETDTYGNVVQEAMASGVPSVVMAAGGPAHIIGHDRDGLVAGCPAAFRNAVVELAQRPAARLRMGLAARQAALGASWDSVFRSVYEAYAELPRGERGWRAAADPLAVGPLR